MARTKPSRPVKSITSSRAAADRTARTEATRRGPVETSDARTKPRSNPAAIPETTRKTMDQSKIQSTNKTETKARMETKIDGVNGAIRKTKATGRKHSQASEPEPLDSPIERRPAPAILRILEGPRPVTNGYVAAEVEGSVLDETEVLDLPDTLVSPLVPRAKVDRSEKEEAIFRRLKQELGAFVSTRELGLVTGDARFEWSEANGLDLRPDLAFVSFERWAPHCHVPKNEVWHVVPDLVVEIIRRPEQIEKLSDGLEAYFRSGVNRVWIIYPEQHKIHDHDSLASSRVLGRDDVIEGRVILPGFQLPVKELLAE